MCTPTDNLILVGQFMIENYDLNTPVNERGPTGQGSRLYDYRGTSYSILLDGTYAFNEITSCNMGFQHTEAMGTVDEAGDYAFDKLTLAVKHKLTPNQTIDWGYEFYNFSNHGGGNFDDYTANGAFVAYTYAF